ncbi:MAG: hypothetical protein KKH94_11545, partial [Candidatus Omnitrophica bacterium]|nr:hypothetical protein [Candidatus Omnitrophota bacterium]
EKRKTGTGIVLTILYIIFLHAFLLLLVNLHFLYISANLLNCKGEFGCIGLIVIVPAYLIISSIFFSIIIYKSDYKRLFFCMILIFALFAVWSFGAATKDYRTDKRVFLDGKNYIFELDKSIINVVQGGEGTEICLRPWRARYSDLYDTGENSMNLLRRGETQLKLFDISSDFSEGNIEYINNVPRRFGSSYLSTHTNIFTLDYNGKYDIHLSELSQGDMVASCKDGTYIRNNGIDINTRRPQIIIEGIEGWVY